MKKEMPSVDQSPNEPKPTLSEMIGSDSLPSSKDLPEIMEMEDGAEKDGKILAYCIAHGKKEAGFKTFTREETVASELQAFEQLAGRPATDDERRFLEEYI